MIYPGIVSLILRLNSDKDRYYQKNLLKEEGIKFKSEFGINLKEYLWIS